MDKSIQFIAIFLAILNYSTNSFAQECSVSLSGTYQLDKESGEGLYDAFVFDGAGKVGIHTFMESRADFFQVGDTIIIYPDKSIFKLVKKDEQTLIGVNMWVKDQIFRKMENDTVTPPAQSREKNYAVRFYEYYKLTGRDAPTLSTYMNINMDSTMYASMDRLCDEGLPKACITMANALMLQSPELGAYLRGKSDENQKMAPNKDIFEYYLKAIELDELGAIAQLGAYFLMLGHTDQAKKVFEKGCELGHTGCCLSLASLEIDWDEDEDY